MYYFTYPFKKMYISQNYNQGNHKPHWYGSKNYKDYPIDECCGDTKRDPVYAPVDMKVIKIYGLNTTKTTNAIVLQTTSTVKTPIGDKTVIITLTHPEESDIKKLKVGQIIKKGKIICYEGRDGEATGNHIHLTVGTGSYKGLYENSNGKWCFVETTTNKPEEIMYVNTKFTKILNSDGINWKKVTTDIVPTPKQKFKIGDKVIINGPLYVSSNAVKPSGSVKNKKTKITRYAKGAKHPYNTTGDLGWMNESDIKKL